MNNKERRDNEMSYIADAGIQEELARTRVLLQRYNAADRGDTATLLALARELLGCEHDVWLNPPFSCDYGSNIRVGKNFFANYNCTIVDVAQVTFGDNCLLGPNVAIYTAGHPVHPDTRNSGYEYGIGVSIGDNVWIGGSAVICPGVHIGCNSVIGAGSVVTRDIPAWSVAAGNPCRVIRPITEEDRRCDFHRRLIDDEAWRQICGEGLADN